jgi:hypothetical protein
MTIPGNDMIQTGGMTPTDHDDVHMMEMSRGIREISEDVLIKIFSFLVLRATMN